MKRSKSEQLGSYIFACPIALVPSSTLLAGFAVKRLLAVWLFLVGEAEGTTHISSHRLHVVHI